MHFTPALEISIHFHVLRISDLEDELALWRKELQYYYQFAICQYPLMLNLSISITFNKQLC